jgi:dihydropyrimidine dehydrogenase (NAD+) subunit PreA
VQVCTAVMHYGYRIVEDMSDGLLQWMRRKGYETIDDFRGLSLPNVDEWKNLNMSYQVIAHIDESKCIGCELCYTACWDGAHQCIHLDRALGAEDTHTTPQQMDEHHCVGCNLCSLVCPVPECITMVEVDNGLAPITWAERVAAGYVPPGVTGPKDLNPNTP